MYTYNKNETIRTRSELEIIHQQRGGWIARLNDVEYKNIGNGKWSSVGSRWLINSEDIQEVLSQGFKSVQL